MKNRKITIYADASLISLSFIFFPPILVLTTLPSGETRLVTVKFIPLSTVITLMSFKPPLVDPEEPPISIRTIRIISEELLHIASSYGGTTFAPVVVIAETMVNNSSIGTILFVTRINALAITIKQISNWNWTSFKTDFPFVFTIL